jgi:hypothetical protein
VVREIVKFAQMDFKMYGFNSNSSISAKRTKGRDQALTLKVAIRSIGIQAKIQRIAMIDDRYSMKPDFTSSCPRTS